MMMVRGGFDGQLDALRLHMSLIIADQKQAQDR